MVHNFAGTLFIGDASNCRIRAVTNGTIKTIAGTGGVGFTGDNVAATSSDLYYPYGVTYDSNSGNSYGSLQASHCIPQAPSRAIAAKS